MLPYSKIFSRFLGKITDYKLAYLSENDLTELEIEWLHSVLSKPRVIKIFKSVSLDDEMKQMSFELNYSVNTQFDEDFVTGLLALGMAVEWLQPQVDSVINIAPMIGGKEEKKILDNHKYSIERLESMKTELNKTIRDYGYMYNSYISD